MLRALMKPAPTNDHQDGSEIAGVLPPQLTKREAMIVGYMHTWACCAADDGEDVREKQVPELLDQVTHAMRNEPHARDTPALVLVLLGAMAGFVFAFWWFVGQYVAPFVR